MLSESVMDACGFTVGETLEFPLWTDADGETLKLQICGIFKETDSTDTFWYTAPNTMEQEMFVSEETFDAIVKQFAPEKINYATNVLLDYTKINQKNVADVQYYIEQFHKEDESFTDSFLNLLKQYQKDKKTIDITLWVLELPLLGLVLAFIYMVTGQIIDTEQGEIAMMRSRGYRFWLRRTGMSWRQCLIMPMHMMDRLQSGIQEAVRIRDMRIFRRRLSMERVK